MGRSDAQRRRGGAAVTGRPLALRLVIDASVAIEVALFGGRLENLTGHDLVAPTLLRSEATSILAEGVRRVPGLTTQARWYYRAE